MTQISNSVVNKQEAEALKELIFNRARERAQNLENEIKDDYTTSTQNDIMNLARDSFVANKNPFSTIKETKTNIKNTVERKNEEIGFPTRKTNEIKKEITSKTTETKDAIANSEIHKAMLDARQDFSKKTTFMGALNFLNAQASISLINKKAKSFEALA